MESAQSSVFILRKRIVLKYQDYGLIVWGTYLKPWAILRTKVSSALYQSVAYCSILHHLHPTVAEAAFFSISRPSTVSSKQPRHLVKINIHGEAEERARDA